MMTLGVYSLPETIRESEGEAADLPVAHRDAVVREAVLVYYHII